MAGLQRSEVSFRRQGSSGLVWDDRFLSDALKQQGGTGTEPHGTWEGLWPPGGTKQDEQGQLQDSSNPAKIDAVRPTRNLGPINTNERSRSNGGRRSYRTGKVTPAIEPPSPKVSACGFCSAFGKPPKNHRKKPGKIRSR
ncbi:MAPK SUBSTRATES IN THE STOMATAL LINEAGE 1 [Hibiscus trionum]|uniref:MAPK SUBSTRATES IN THE STOMATAL LINEAGE 1 n=1 Tax=Hibiscus trionum TaxID=183268 RepID=A0A9W7HRX6_HIBTR|nr:MAPK SUBSTRATES IN THE STOMATAL LINEAGE 1 [Hibiscus trionum]